MPVMTPEKLFLKHENIKRWRLLTLGFWVFAMWITGTALHPFPLTAAVLVLGLQAAECIRAGKVMPWALAVAALIGLACWASAPSWGSEIPPELEDSTTFGLTIRLQQADAAGMTVHLFRPESDEILRAAAHGALYRYENRRWTPVDPDPDRVNKHMNLLPQDGSTYELQVDWTGPYGTLSPGWYRALVDMTRQLPGTKNVHQESYFVVQFEIK